MDAVIRLALKIPSANRAFDARREAGCPRPLIRMAAPIRRHLRTVGWRPAILLRRRYPMPLDLPPVFHMKDHHMMLRHDNLFDLRTERRLVKFLQPEYRNAFLEQNLLWDAPLYTATSVLSLFRIARPVIGRVPVLPRIVDIALAADAALDFPVKHDVLSALFASGPSSLRRAISFWT